MKATKQLDRIATAVETAAATPRGRDSSRHNSDKLPLRGRIRVFLFASKSASAIARQARRSFPIHAYVGPNGGGKSLAMVNDTIPSLRAGRRVLSTVRLIDPRTGEDHPAYERFHTFDQLLDARDCDILMDEVVGIAGARESQKLDPRVQNVLVQLRRRNCTLRITAPNWLRADKIIREVTQAVTECRGYYADRNLVRAGENDAVQLWAPKRLFNFRTYDVIDFDEWTAGRREKVSPIANEWFVGRGSEAFRTYDTLDAVERVGGIGENSECEVCGGHRRRPACSCGSVRRRVALDVRELVGQDG